MENRNELRLEVSKDFTAPVERLYKAWVSEEDLKQWWHPMGNTLQELVNDLTEGGEVRYVFVTEGGEHSFTIRGNYEEVKEGERLVYTWNWELPTEAVNNSNYRLIVEFKEEGSGSRLQVTQENFADEEAVQPHREGWNKALDELAQHLLVK